MADDFCLQAYAAARNEQRFRLLSVAAGALLLTAFLSWGFTRSTLVSAVLGLSSSSSLLAGAWFFWRSGSVGFLTAARHVHMSFEISDNDSSVELEGKSFTEDEIRTLEPRAVRWHSLMFMLMMIVLALGIGVLSAALLTLALSTRT